MSNLSESKLQLLVDHELNYEDRQAFLAETNQSPDHWREVALAFAEHQIL